MKKDLNYYMNLPYSFVVQHVKDKDGDYYWARVTELDGCHSHGETRAIAMDNLMDAFEGYLEVKLEYGDPIPEPVTDDSYSGRFMVRIPKSLHRKLAFESQKEGISLNQYTLYKLSQA